MKWPVLGGLFFFFASFSCFNNLPGQADKPLPESSGAFVYPVDSADWARYGIRLKPEAGTYAGAKTNAQKRRSELAGAFRHGAVSLDSAGVVFEKILLEGIVPHWYGTPWSFEGHTETPGSGRIACGYFISTSLLHAGVRLNRYRLAQQNPETEAKAIAMGDPVSVFRGDWLREVAPVLQTTLKDGLYFAGLGGSHVVYLLKRKGALFVLHSNYTYPAQVLIEPAGERSVISNYPEFFIVPVSGNKRLIEAWLLGTELRVP